MSDAKGQDRNTRIGLNRPAAPKIEIKKTVESGVVKQSFSHGRTKAVTFEVKRTPTTTARPVVTAKPGPVARSPEPSSSPTPPSATPTPAAPTPNRAEIVRNSVAPSEQNRGGARKPMVLRPLTDDEKQSRLRALSTARKDEEDARRRADENARRAAEELALRRAEEEAAATRKAEEEARKRAEEEAKRKAEAQATRLAEVEERKRKEQQQGTSPARPVVEAQTSVESPASEEPKRVGDAPAKRPLTLETDEEAEARRNKLKGRVEKRAVLKPARDDKRPIRVTADGEEVERVRSVAAYRRQMQRAKQQQQVSNEPIVRDVVLPETITVQELASRMAVRGAEVIKALMKNGIMATINQVLDADTAEIVISDFGHRAKRVSEADVEVGIEGKIDAVDKLIPRPAVVTVMGHVDHGKTSLLDALRSSNVVAGEAGGITQHIGAYQVAIGGGAPVTFIDTPGHAAFSSMRARGASVTDIVVLVVAADDGVMPQTIEAIRHAKAANVPIVVAINKIDKPDSNPERVKTDLLSHEVVVEDYGGDVMAIPVSALKREGLDRLIETIQLQAEILDLKANPARDAQGTIIEAKLDRGRGVVATVLVQNGTLRVGDIVIAGAQWGRVRALVGDQGQTVTEAGPSTPVEILGLDGVAEPGDKLQVVENEKKARDIAEYRQRKKRETSTAVGGVKSSLEEMFSQLKSGESKELPIVVKSDVHGSLEAIVAGLDKLKTDEVGVRILHGGVGAITESDVTLAMASKALIVGFNVRANAQAREMSRREGIDIRYYSIIYELLDEAKAMLSGMLKPESKEVILGHAEIREVFNITKTGKVAGCMVTDGLFKRAAKARLLRDNVVVYDGVLSSLKRFKDDVREVKEGFECGMSIEGYADIRQGDVIEAYEVEEVARTL